MLRNKKPFFYEKKGTPTRIKLLILLIILTVLVTWGANVPMIRQTFSHFIFSKVSYGKSLFIPVETPNLDNSPNIQYPTLELPDKEVLFASDITELLNPGEVQKQFTLPTPEITKNGVEWVYASTEIPAYDSGLETNYESATVIPPVFERADFLNDGPAALSAIIRFWGLDESQYLIADQIRSGYWDPIVSMEELNTYVNEFRPNLNSICRVNGTTEILKTLIEQGIPVVLRIESQDGSSWKGDDNIISRYILLTGFDDAAQIFIFQDPGERENQQLPYSELMAAWYAFSREYLIVFPPEKAETVQLALSENWDESTNLEIALQKYKTDIEMVPSNVYAWLNYGFIQAKSNDFSEAWISFESAEQLGIPQRFYLYMPILFETGVKAGYPDKVLRWTDFAISLNEHTVEAWLWRGWAFLTKGDRSQAETCFQKAHQIAPENSDVQYAIAVFNQDENQ